MKKRLFINLVMTLALSIVLTEALFLIYYLVRSDKFEELIVPAYTYFLACVLMNIVLLISSLPVFLLTIQDLYENRTKRVLIYFSLPLLVLLQFIIFNDGIWADRAVIMISGVSYLVFHSLFYRRIGLNRSMNNGV